jgi:chemotaxis protein CheX
MTDQHPGVLPTEHDLDSIAEQVWAAFLGDGEEAVVDSAQASPDPELAASVAIAGAYEGHVIVSCTRVGSLDVASALFGMSAEELTADEVGDALGELVNVLGGNVKSMLPAPSTMSLPSVAGAEAVHWPATVEVCRTVVDWRGNQFVLILLSGQGKHDRLERVVA